MDPRGTRGGPSWWARPRGRSLPSPWWGPGEGASRAPRGNRGRRTFRRPKPHRGRRPRRRRGGKPRGRGGAGRPNASRGEGPRRRPAIGDDRRPRRVATSRRPCRSERLGSDATRRTPSRAKHGTRAGGGRHVRRSRSSRGSATRARELDAVPSKCSGEMPRGALDSSIIGSGSSRGAKLDDVSHQGHVLWRIFRLAAIRFPHLAAASGRK